MPLTVASLFAGIGGFDVAAHRLGWQVAIQAENDPAAQSVLRAHFPDARLASDATRVELHGIDVVTAGFPCQGLSNAAATRRHGGLLDPKSASHVVWRVLERIAEARPEYVLFENADSLSTARYAEDLRALLGLLESIGYHPYVVPLNSGCYGSVMRRVRTFILCRRRYWFAPPVEANVRWSCDAKAIGVNNQQGGAMFCGQPSVTKKATSFTLMVTPDEVRSMTPEAVEPLFGLPAGWTEPAGSNAQRYQRLGNAVSVDAAEAALSLLVHGRAEARTPDYEYIDLYPLTRPAIGGTAGSAVGRIVRSLELERGNHNRLELEYCLPVYIEWMEQHDETVTDRMRGYVHRLGRMLRSVQATPWPRKADVVMQQG